MHNLIETACLVAFVLLTILPGVYGLHLYALMFFTELRRRRVRRAQAERMAAYQASRSELHWPRVTTQIPLYNELAVARRVIEAVAAIDYPADRHQIQVLDDSDDDTRTIVDHVVRRLQDQGCNISVVRRPSREHYKAGALAAALESADGDYVAIFDADFAPDPGFLRRMIPLIDGEERVACVQGRWGHLNRHENWITESLSLGIDGHFGIEQGARAWNGFLLNFNGTAGIWRKSAIVDPRVGGWSGDTITEDLDLSYRAQLAGWRIVYSIDEECPAEIPADANALKAQQRRWATGSIQTARKILPRVWRSDLTIAQKAEATIHLTGYSISVFVLLMLLFGRSLLSVVDPDRAQAWLAWSWCVVLAAAAAPSIAYIYARWVLKREFAGFGRILKLIALGMGLSVNNAFAVVVGLWQQGGEFVRTPKSGAAGHRRRVANYAIVRSRLWMIELLAGAVCFAQWVYYLRADYMLGGTFLLFAGIGSAVLGWASRPRCDASAAPALASPNSGSIAADSAIRASV